MKGRRTSNAGQGIWGLASVCRAPAEVDALHSLLLAALLLGLTGCGGLKLPTITVPTVAANGTVLEAGVLEDKPVAGAWVTISGSAPALTDNSGRFTVHVPVPDTTGGLARVAISIAKHGYLARLIEDRTIRTDAANELGEFYLVPAQGTSSLRGRVVDKTTGRGIPNAEVIFIGDLTLHVRTAADGSFLLSGILPNAGTFPVKARHPDFLTIFNLQTGRDHQPVTIRSGDESVNSVTLELYPLGTPAKISGRVVNGETLEPVVGATVTIGTKQTTTDAEGNFSIPDAPTGLQAVRVEHPSFMTFKEQVLINGDFLTVFLFPPGNLPPLPFTLAGRVTLQGETNHSGVRVEARRKSDGIVVDVAITGIDGTYALWVPPGTYLVRASKEGYAGVEQEVVVRKGVAVTNVNFTLARRGGAP